MEQFINISHSTPQSSMVGIFYNQHAMLINHLLLVFKFCIYSAKSTKQLNFDNLKKTVKKIKQLEKELTESNKLKLLQKWQPIHHISDWYSFQSEKGGGCYQLMSFLIYFCLLFFVFVFGFWFLFFLFPINLFFL